MIVKNIIPSILYLLIAAMVICGCRELEEPENQEEHNQEPPEEDVYIPSEAPDPFSWIATDSQGNSIDPDTGRYPDSADRDGKVVAVFYFLWHGCHGYDTPANCNTVIRPTSADTGSPYDIQKLLDENPVNPELGHIGVMYHWGEPYLGYYVSNDEWVIRKHAQMLVDAGVDAIFFDVTNGFHYYSVFERLANIYTEMRAEGNRTPQFAFLLNSNAGSVSQFLYDDIYSSEKYKDLWFMWEGKPVMLANPSEVPAEFRDFFTLRQSWFLSNNAKSDKWFGSGEDKWPWGSVYPQKAGKHSGKNEFVPVMPATHPTSKVGRSFDATSGTEPSHPTPEKGIYFKKQFERALNLDPQIIFFTGWNEWTAQRQSSSNTPPPYFVDQYNHEFSRDIEPLNGGFGDNYYYLMADFIRKFKGAKKLPVFKENKTITIDGSFADWSEVAARWGDDVDDIRHRNHFGWGRIGQYINDTGRNDIVLTEVTNDSNKIYFYVRTASDITPCTDPQWMQLFIRVDGTKAGWEGYDFAVNRSTPAKGNAVLEKSQGGWKWKKVSDISYRVNGKEMELAIPLSSLGIKNSKEFTVDFKWIDNAACDGEIQTCMRNGDSAPNGRFRYRYKYKE
ncbi:MAG: hypothetical protein IJS30_02240 [Bacteroidales bacterium]|nr:hypothetical protein [Bacteroidales bacterium]